MIYGLYYPRPNRVLRRRINLCPFRALLFFVLFVSFVVRSLCALATLRAPSSVVAPIDSRVSFPTLCVEGGMS